MKTTCIFLLIIISVNLFAQDTIYLNKELKEVPYDYGAAFYKLIENKDDKVHETTYFINGKLKSSKIFSDYENKILDGLFTEYFDNGQIARKVVYSKNKLHGEQLYYWENGIMKRKDIYDNNVIIEGNCFASDGGDTIYYPFYLLPVYPGGEDAMWRYIFNNTIYPTKMKDNLISGNAKASFIIDIDGRIKDLNIISQTHNEFGSELRRIISMMPDWFPALRDGEPVPITYTIPLKFTLK